MILVLLIAWQSVAVVPEAVRRDLDELCKGWTLAGVIPEVADEIRGRTPEWPANFISGDFNGDGRPDAAVLAHCDGNVQLLAFLAGTSGYTRHVIEKAQPLDPREFLHLIYKDSGGGYERDAIGVEYHSIGGKAWIFRDNRWQAVAR
jgi:hypothetical protein